ncbi:sulfatase-like hydrolase/transferase [Streptomyces sp. NBC_00063]|uniref:sulfatase-like hydrolase/transferase n=1 Tax=Streptomyces sp. NBC_00063 TaxID=2975638 RepID=UPI002257FEF4|nr:sulfatase-like hydrolase/transferase [Streptomyces sp. NBC_00063]MCX5443480.1 sulfatase-like hydrolase/transferase [Streptomyces sp. NBC_00063]
MKKKPNILLVVSDQERQRGWLPPQVRLPWRERLLAEGLEFTNYWTHSAPCSPSRATMMTGQYVTQHQVAENVIFPWQPELPTTVPTIGTALRKAGYGTSYIGKWHLSRSARPDMEAYGYGDWDGNDHHFMGMAGTGVHFDPVIAANAANWLRHNAGSQEPWFLTVALVNPHDVMWYPIDQPEYQRANPRMLEFVRSFLDADDWGRGQAIPPFEDAYDEIFDELPENFDDDLHTKPDTQRQWRHDQQNSLWGRIEPKDKKSWLRQLDYYVRLHQLGDESLGTVLGALEESGGWNDTVIIFTSDHGDMCGSHGLRSKGPFVYDEIMRVPCYVKATGLTRPGSTTDSLASHVDLASTICALAGAAPAPSFRGKDLSPILSDPAAKVRDYVLFAHDSVHTRQIQQTRYAVRGMFDGRYKYARYFGVGGGLPADRPEIPEPTKMLFGPDADFDDCDHELYDLQDDPHELVNLAMDRGRRNEMRDRFTLMRSVERTDLAPLKSTGP